MRVVFRCDSSFSIGSGHLMRCLNLARLLSGEAIFICRNLSGNLNSLVTQNQFKLIELSDIKDYEIEQPIDEEEDLKSILEELTPDVMIVDHYGLGFQWEKFAKKYAKKVLAIDDLGRKHSSQGILDQNFRPQVPENYLKSDAELFLGPQFALLNQRFLSARSPERNFRDMKSILVFYGGSDLFSMTLKTLRLVPKFDPTIQWEVVIGQQSKDLKEIELFGKAHPNVRTHVNIDYMHQLMANTDLFVGAGGTTSWERIKLGLPSIVVSIARNQEDICHSLQGERVISYLGSAQSVSEGELLKELDRMIAQPERRKELSQNSLKLEVSSHLPRLVNFIELF